MEMEVVLAMLEAFIQFMVLSILPTTNLFEMILPFERLKLEDL